MACSPGKHESEGTKFELDVVISFQLELRPIPTKHWAFTPIMTMVAGRLELH